MAPRLFCRIRKLHVMCFLLVYFIFILLSNSYVNLNENSRHYLKRGKSLPQEETGTSTGNFVSEDQFIYPQKKDTKDQIVYPKKSDKLEFHKPAKFHAAAKQYGFKQLPEEVANNVSTFVYFIGPVRSSHSIIGSYIDAHSNALVADEFDLFGQMMANRKLIRSKSDVSRALWEGSWLAVNGGNRVETFKGYNLTINGLKNGGYENFVHLVGDKIGYLTVDAYKRNKMMFKKTLNQLKRWFNVKTIFVVRNPFDNVATLTMYSHITDKLKIMERGTDHIRQYKSVDSCKNRTEVLLYTPDVLAKAVSTYSTWISETHELVTNLKPDLKIVKIHEFIREPKLNMASLCDFLNLKCSDEFLEQIAAKTFQSESKSRYSIQWTRKSYNEVDKLLDLYPQYFTQSSFFD